MDNLPVTIMYDRKNHMRIIRSQLRDEINPFDIDEGRFRELYRLPKHLAINLINTIEGYFDSTSQQTALPVHMQVLIALNFYATGGYQRQVGMNFLSNMSQTKVSDCIRKVSRILSTKLLIDHVKFPTSEEDVSVIKERFFVSTGMPGVVGLIDGTQIKICALKKGIENMYVNRKGFHSVNVQIMCDDQLTIRNVNAWYPGSAHDSFIFNNSHLLYHLRQNFIANDDKFTWLIGDSGYGLQPWLITPFPQSNNMREINFNKKHASVRNAVERCIGLLKVRFRCLLAERGLRYDPTIVGHIINSCCILHNQMALLRPTEAEEQEIPHIMILERQHQINDAIENVEGETIRQKGVRSRNWLMDRVCPNC